MKVKVQLVQLSTGKGKVQMIKTLQILCILHFFSNEAKEEHKMLFLSLSLNESMRYFVSVTKGWLLKRGSRYAESRQIQM